MNSSQARLTEGSFGLKANRGWQIGSHGWDSLGICPLGILQEKAIHQRCHTSEVIVRPREKILVTGPPRTCLCWPPDTACNQSAIGPGLQKLAAQRTLLGRSTESDFEKGAPFSCNVPLAPSTDKV